jgi:hypothetical protein
MQRFIVIAGCLIALAGCATTPETRFSGAASEARTSDCIQTGTRIRLTEDQCSPSPGRSYSQEELQSTGGMTVVESLRKLDPRF